MKGAERVVFRSPMVMTLHDISDDGQVLLQLDARSHRAFAWGAGRDGGVDVSPFRAFTELRAVSDDGTQLLLATSALGSERMDTYLSSGDSPAVLLGDGVPFALSPDGRWALVANQDRSECLRLLPVRAGLPQELRCGPWMEVFRAFWLPGAAGVLLDAREAGHLARVWIAEPDGGVHPVTEEGVVTAAPASPDGRWLAVYDQSGQARLLALDGGASLPLPGLKPFEFPTQWTPDGRGLFVRRLLWTHEGVGPFRGMLTTAPPTEVLRYDLDAGAASHWKTIQGLEWKNSGHIDDVLITPDGTTWAYGEYQQDGELYVVDGLR